MRKLSKIFGVALIATSMLVSVTGCSNITQGDVDYWKALYEEEKAKNEALSVALQEKNAEADKLLEEVNAEKDKNKSAEELRAKYEKQLADLKAERDDLADKVNTVETELDSAKTELENLNAKIAELELAINGLTIYLEVYLASGEKASDSFQNALESKTINVPNGTKGDYLLEMFKVDGDNGCLVMNKYTGEVTFYEAKPTLDNVIYLDIASLVVKESDIEISNGTSLSNSMTIKIMLDIPSSN